MSQNKYDLSIQTKLILEHLQLMETEEIRSAHTRHDTNEWTDLAFQIMEKVLADRDEGFKKESEFSENNQVGAQFEEDDSDFDDEMDSPLDLSQINWQEDSVDTIYFELCKRTLMIGDPEFLVDGPKIVQFFEDYKFSCIQCGEKLSWIQKICPKCHLELFPQTDDRSQVLENSRSEFVAELASLSAKELQEIWSENDPMEWDLEEMSDLRAEFAKRGFFPPYLLDAPEDLVNRLPYLTIEELSLRGWPGYRNRPGRCGLDPLDRNAEEGYIIGKMLRYLFTLKLQTPNNLYIFLMFISGVFLSIPILSVFAGFYLFPLIFLPYTLTGIMLLLNSSLSIIRKSRGGFKTDEESPFFPPE